MKQIGIALLFAVIIYSCQSSTKQHKPGIIKTDTITAVYITSAFGSLMGGPAIRTISYKEKVTTTDSVSFTKGVELDTTCVVYVQQPLIDSLTKKQKSDSLGNLQYKTVTYTLPGKYVKDTGIPTH